MLRWTENTSKTWMLLGAQGAWRHMLPAMWERAKGSPARPHLRTSGHRRADSFEGNQSLQGRIQTGSSPKKQIPPNKSNAQERRHGRGGGRAQVLCWVSSLLPPPAWHRQLKSGYNMHQVLSCLLPTGPFEKALKEEGIKIRLLSWLRECPGERTFSTAMRAGLLTGSQTCYAWSFPLSVAKPRKEMGEIS